PERRRQIVCLSCWYARVEHVDGGAYQVEHGLPAGWPEGSCWHPISRPCDRRMLSAILACIVRRCAVADRIAGNWVDRTRPIAKIWVNGLSAWCDTTRAPP